MRFATARRWSTTLVHRSCADANRTYVSLFILLFTKKPSLLQAKLGERARQAAEQKHAWALLAPRLEAVYDRARAGF